MEAGGAPGGPFGWKVPATAKQFVSLCLPSLYVCINMYIQAHTYR